MPTITAVIPCYNAAPFIAEAIASVQRQTRPVDEIIVVDDCSTDDSASIARGMGVQVVSTDENGGAAKSRNIGLRTATGELVAFLDADDWWVDQHCATMEGLLGKHPDADLAFGLVQLIGDYNNLWWTTIPEDETVDAFWECVKKVIAQASGSMVRRSAALEVGGFDESLRYSEDFEFLLRFSRHHKFVCVHEVTAYYRKYATQTSRNLAACEHVCYNVRRHLWQETLAAGDTATAERLGLEIRRVWDRHLWRAFELRDRKKLRMYLGLADNVPDNGALRRQYELRGYTLWAMRLWDRLPNGVRSSLKLRLSSVGR
jgi:glycosyltransferase involved in cell wall biosynthesis